MTWVANKDIMSANINRLLEEKGKTRKEACEDMGIGYSTFTEWANGRKYPRIDKIEIMANYFGVQKSDLIENKSVKHKTPLKPKHRQLWLSTFHNEEFTDEEFADIISYAKFVLSKRPADDTADKQ